MKVQEIAKEITKWFQRTGGGGLILPDGWFGRPYDNIHQLTFIEIRSCKIIIELDEQLHLLLTEPKSITCTNGEIILGGFRQCVFDWQEYGSNVSHCSSFTSGELKFVAPPGM